MILNRGQWLGKGKLLVEGASLGEELELELEISEDDAGMTLSGNVSGSYKGDVSIRIAPDEVGTYVIDARIASLALDGRAKLESEPNLALLWNEGQTQSASVSLFRTPNGIGCRGFWQENTKTRTWEIQFKLRQVAIGGSNVVSLRRR